MNREPVDTAIPTYYFRRGRFSKRHGDALAELGPQFCVPAPAEGESWDYAELFGRSAPVVMEIGSGMGDTTARMAAADPDRDYLACEVHPPGVANLLTLIEDAGLTNVRIYYGDAVAAAGQWLSDGELDAIHAFFPDPWPKAKHHKRRLVRSELVHLLAAKLREDGKFWCATDWAHYAEAMLHTLRAEPQLQNTVDGFAPRPAMRPLTKFEQRGINAGRDIFDLVFTKVAR